MRFRTFILVSIVSFGLFVWANYASWRSFSMGEEEGLGKEVWQKYNCVSCHTLFGNGGYVGKDLTHITSLRSQTELLDFFSNPPVLPPHKKEKHPALTRKETERLIFYFEYIDAIPTLGWPPVQRSVENGEKL